MAKGFTAEDANEVMADVPVRRMCLCSGTGSYKVCRRDADGHTRIVEKECACDRISVDFPYEDVTRRAKMAGTVYAPKGAPRTPLSKASEALQRHAQRVGL